MRFLSSQFAKIVLYFVIFGLILIFAFFAYQNQSDKLMIDHQQDPFVLKKMARVVSFNNHWVTLMVNGDTINYPLDIDPINDEGGILVIRRELKGSFYQSLKSQFNVNDIGREVMLINIWIRPKPELPEKQVLAIYL